MDFPNAQNKPAGAIPVYLTAGGALVGGGNYEACPASATTVLGSTGAIGDFLNSLLIVPGTTSPGAVQIQDGADTAITVFAGGASSVSNKVSFNVYAGGSSRTGAWSVICGANVSVLANGSFT